MALFGCGRALGGHTRAHGIGDESGHIDDDDDDANDWEARLGVGGNNEVPPSNKCMYALRANPNRLKSCRVCENCGKEFLSWKPFLEHGNKCSSSEDAESLVSSECDLNGRPRSYKRKRSLGAQMDIFNYNSNCPSSEEEDLANCLMMLSNATADPLDAQPEESCASASKVEERRNTILNFIAPNIACRVLVDNANIGGVANKALFECKACKKVFNSHQALGGHRASHKKVKGCFAVRLDDLMDDNLADHDVIRHQEFFPTKSASTMQFDHGTINTTSSMAPSSKRKSKVHECSICHLVFSSGQALGGHKRCHWITSNSPDASKFQQFHRDHVEQIQQRPKFIETSDLLDLNLPAPEDDHTGGPRNHVDAKEKDGVDAEEKDIGNQHNQIIDQNNNYKRNNYNPPIQVN